MDEVEMKEQQREYEFTSILNHPEDYSEEDLRAFFSQPENKADYRLYRLVQMAGNREQVALPDVDRAWHSFKQETFSAPKQKVSSIRMWGAALLGAVAVCIGFLLYFYVFKSSFANEDLLVAMEYDATPQLVVLRDEGKSVKSFTKKDSISFLTPSLPQTQALVSAAKEEKTKTRTVSTPRGVDFKITLPDGTDVWLNAESSLQFPSAFTKDTRRVILSGEAYFKVAHDSNCPFIVETDKMKVRVLGTEFNFRNYISEKPQVSLIDGSISILSLNESDPDIILKPGQGACVEEDGHIHVLQGIDIYGTVQWINGYFYFKNRPLIEILQELGRWYNVGVVFENPATINEKMHFSALRSANIREAIDNLNRLRKVQIVLEDNKIIVR